MTMTKSEQGLRDLWPTVHQTSTCTVRFPEYKQWEEGAKNIWRNNGWKLPKYNKIPKSTHPRSSMIPNRINGKTFTLWHIIVKLWNAKNKDRFLRAATEKQLVMHMESSITTYFSSDTMEARRYLTCWKSNNNKENSTKNSTSSKTKI